jgi:two-component system, cell cycle sensor histidine kinase and response regulator CckA
MSPEEARSNPIVERSADSTPGPEADSGQALRKRAEALAGESAGGMPEDLEVLSPEAARRALHELRVHQIELEMQNEELRRTQEELEVSRARYFDLYDLAPVGYFTLSEHGLILEANLTAAKLLGAARGALVKQPLSGFVVREDQDIHYRHRKQLLDTGAPQSWELRLLRKDAGPFWARVEATRARDDDGGSVWRAVVSDITESKRTEDEKAKLEAQNLQLQKAEGLGRMAGAIAHHFNNHLTAVMGNLELAIGDLPHGAVSAGKLTDALHAARNAAEVSTLMLTYLGQTHAQHEPLDLSEVCRRSLPLLRAAMPKDMVLDAELPSPGPVISANANQLQQILTNLVTNAWEAGVDGPRIVRVTVKTVLAAGIPASDRFPIDWQPHEIVSYACMEVVDEGSGIAAKNIEKLFDPFFSSKFTGRGLGLSVVLGIVRAHVGAVTVETAPGKGSTFRVFLPLSAESVIRQPDQATQSPEIDGGGTVLLVDDEPMVRKVGEGALMRLGFAVLLAKDGVEAVETFRQHRDEVCCVLCDLTMPRMNGWETLNALRKLAPGLPVILASGYDEAYVMAGDHPELPQAFLSKPYQLQALRDAIGRALVTGRTERILRSEQRERKQAP